MGRMVDVGGTGVRAVMRNTILYHKTDDGWIICGEHISPTTGVK